jgi:hypothetical protein
MKPKGLTARQQQFCVQWLVHNDATKAYREVYKPPHSSPATVQVSACRLLARPLIQKEISRLQETRDTPKILNANQVLEELTLIVSKAPFYSDKTRALDLLGKYHKLFSDAPVFNDNRQMLIQYSDPNTGGVLTTSPLRKQKLLQDGKSSLNSKKEEGKEGKSI